MTEPRDTQGIGHNSGVRVVLSRTLADLFPGTPTEMVLDAQCVDDITRALDARWPGMRDRIVDSTPAIRRHLNVFVDGAKAKLDTAVPQGGTVYILTAMSGG